MNVAQKILAERGARIHFISIRNERGVENFFYLLMKEGEFQKMQSLIDSGEQIEPRKFGVVLLQGVGTEPIKEVDEVLQRLIEENK